MTPYTAYPDIQGIIYEDETNKIRLMRTDELHKFSAGTLNHVCTALNDIATGLEMDYLPKRKWSKQDKKRARVMIKVDPYGFEEHQSDTQVITVKMEILLKPISNKLMVDEMLKLKNLKKDALLKLFKLTYQERYEHVSPKVTSSQDGKVYEKVKRDYAWLMISRCSRSHIHTQVKLKEQAKA
ncbi:hypothetical protein Tco_1485670 [Tanacetum coccineum]